MLAALECGKITTCTPKAFGRETDGTNLMAARGRLPVAPLVFERSSVVLLKAGSSWYLKKLWSSQKKWNENSEIREATVQNKGAVILCFVQLTI